MAHLLLMKGDDMPVRTFLMLIETVIAAAGATVFMALQLGSYAAVALAASGLACALRYAKWR